jgi:egghead protein (zeste-white 4 protein)
MTSAARNEDCPTIDRLPPEPAAERPRAFAAEPRRDWRFGWLTGHRTLVVACLLLTFAISAGLRLIAPQPNPPTSWFDQLAAWGSLLWLSALIPGTIGLMGTLSYSHPSRLDDATPIARTICWRIVTAGKNLDIVRSTIRRCQREMARTPLAPYIIEVVIDEGADLSALPGDDDDVRLIVTPRGYRAPNGSRFKARALHYALLHSPIPEKAWIVHLDEETQPTPSGVKGICKFIAAEEASGRLRIGQGALLYHREWSRHPFLTLADNVRTGDDFARFFFQHSLGLALFGLHGSYIVVRNDVEKATGGFDFGPHGDITEDAFWAMKAMQEGRRTAWVEGYLEEQSCMSLKDFLRQRRRWFQGLVKVVLHAPVKPRWRVFLGLNTILWGIAPLSVLYTLFTIFYSVQIDRNVQLLANFSFGIFAAWYITGLEANMAEHGIAGFWRRSGLRVLQIVLLPVFSLMEGMGVLYALSTPADGFQVVKK